MAGLILKAPYYSPRSTPKNGGTRGGYAEYISTREGVEVLPRGGMADYVGERRGSNGLFSDEDVPIVLSQVKAERYRAGDADCAGKSALVRSVSR